MLQEFAIKQGQEVFIRKEICKTSQKHKKTLKNINLQGSPKCLPYALKITKPDPFCFG